MFGRSGQMFPRRTFHDAIYEEEYGSDNEDECCRCRGLSAILCWFLSVIILVGLAATVVLTVFFILRSRTLMVKPDVDVDVELYGKDQNLYDAKGGGGGSSKELIGSNEVTTTSSSPKRKKSNTKGSGRGPPDATKNDVDADVNEEQNAINDSSELSSNESHDHDHEPDASVNHPRNHPNHVTQQNHNRNRLQPYSPKTTTTTSTTTTSTTTQAPPAAEASEEENNESSSEEETDAVQNNGEGSSLFNLFSGPRNPSYSTPSQTEDEEEEEEEDTEDDNHNENDDANHKANNNASNGVISGESSIEYGNKITRYHPDGSGQVLFTESPKVTVTTPSPYGGRRNLQTTRFSTGRTSFTSTTTTTTEMPKVEEEEESEEEKHEEGGDDNEEEQEENDGEDHEHNDDEEKSSEEKAASVGSSPQTTTSVYDGKEGEAGSESGESQLKQMLLDSIPPHGNKKDDEEEIKDEEDGSDNDDEEMGGMSSSSEFNLSQKIHPTTEEPSTTTQKPAKTLKTPKPRGDTLTRLISRNFTRKTTSTTTETSGSGSSETETQTDKPSVTTIGPAGHKYDYTMTPNQRGKLKVKSGESVEQEVTSTPKPPPKFTLKQRFRSTTARPVGTPEPPSTAAPRTRGTTSPATSSEYGIKLGAKRGSVESPIDIVPSPDLSPKGQLKQQLQKLKEQREREKQKNQPNSFEGVDLNSASSEDTSKTSSEQQFLDVLVGADDQKTLVTKHTQDGIVTSAILPPWYDASGANSSISDVLATNGTTLSNTVAKVQDEDGATVSGENSFGDKTNIVFKKKSSAEEKLTQDNAASSSKEPQNPSEFERLVNMFSKQEGSSEEIPAPPPLNNRFGIKKQKPVVLKKPGGTLNSRFIRPDSGRTSLFPAPSSSSKEIKSSENQSGVPSPSPASPEADATTNLERPPGDIGRTGVLPTAADVEDAVANSRYYPENGGDRNKVMEHQMMENERLASDELMNSSEDEQENPSHVIDVNIEDGAGKSPAEIVIEPNSSAPLEDEEGDFVEEDDYEGYGENPPTLSMSASAPNQNVLPPPEDYVLRGSGVRRPMSSEEFTNGGDMEPSASSPVENNMTIISATETPQLLSTLSPVAAIRRPAYTREEILKSAVKPSPGSLGGNNLNDEYPLHHAPTGSMEDEMEEEEYEDDNYDGGSVEQPLGGGSLEQWSSEKNGAQKWSAPDNIMDAVTTGHGKIPTLSEELTDPEEHVSAESIVHPTVQQSPLNSLMDDQNHQQQQVDPMENTTDVFRPPQLVSFHENKLSFSPPIQLEGEYHSKDGWRPVISKTPGEGGLSQEATSAQVGSFEHDEHEHDELEHEHDEHEGPHQLYQEHPQQQQQQQVEPTPTEIVQPPPQQQWAQEQPSPSIQQQMMRHPPPPPQQHAVIPPPPQQHAVIPPPPQQHAVIPPPPQQHAVIPPPPQQHSVIPPPAPATVKFPDSEEEHEDRRHNGRLRPRPGQQGRFDRAKYMVRPAAPPIVMRRRPHSGGPFPPPPPGHNTRPPPPPGHNPRQGPPPPHQRPPPPQMMQQAASQQNPQYAEHPPSQPPQQGRPPPPPHPAINRNFHVRPNNPMRRFNFGGGGGPPQAQPRSGGNIKWPTDDGEVSRGDSNTSSQQQNIEGAQSEVSINKRRRRRKRAVIAA